MAEGASSAKGDFFTFLVIVAVLGFAWFSTGGPSRESARDLFLRPLPPLGDGGSYGISFLTPVIQQGGIDPSPNPFEAASEEVSAQSKEAQAEIAFFESAQNASVYKGDVYFTDTWQGLGVENVRDEFVTITASPQNSGPVNITGWKLRSPLSKLEAKIPGAVWNFRSGSAGIAEPVLLFPGEKAVIASGRSPAGSSFRVNKCSGYLEAFQDFAPPLRINCPLPIEEVAFKNTSSLEDACLDFLDRTTACTVFLNALPEGLSNNCHVFVTSTLNYNSCIENHGGDRNFLSGEWRIFLGRDTSLWKRERETLWLLDESGKLVDRHFYN